MEYECCCDRSQLYSDEAPPIGEVAAGFWAEMAPAMAARVLRWN